HWKPPGTTPSLYIIGGAIAHAVRAGVAGSIVSSTRVARVAGLPDQLGSYRYSTRGREGGTATCASWEVGTTLGNHPATVWVCTGWYTGCWTDAGNPHSMQEIRGNTHSGKPVPNCQKTSRP